MSTKEWLDRLDYDQLVYARDEAERRIKEFQDAKKVTVWVVESRMQGVSDHRTYIGAARALLAEAERLVKDPSALIEDMTMTLRPRRLRPDQLHNLKD